MNRFKTPLRYPGGKQRLAPFITEILQENDLIGGHYVEPYAGGAGAALELLLSKKVTTIHLNDSSFPIYAFWSSVLNRNEEFCRLITSASLTVEEWKRQRFIMKHPDEHSELEVGFSTFYLNRCNRSGVLSGGIIGGLEQKGYWKMDARFSRNDLIRRIECIGLNKDYITLTNLDTEEYLSIYLEALPSNTLIYFDPPYYEKSSDLYLSSYKKSDHARLSSIIQNVKAKWILSYDAAEEIVSLYNSQRFFLYDLQYNASVAYKGKEVFFFCDRLEVPKSSILPFINACLPSLVA